MWIALAVVLGSLAALWLLRWLFAGDRSPFDYYPDLPSEDRSPWEGESH